MSLFNIFELKYVGEAFFMILQYNLFESAININDQNMHS